MIACMVLNFSLGPHPIPWWDPRSIVVMLHDAITGASIDIYLNFISRSVFTLQFCIFWFSIPLRLASTKLYPRPFASLLDEAISSCGTMKLDAGWTHCIISNLIFWHFRYMSRRWKGWWILSTLGVSWCIWNHLILKREEMKDDSKDIRYTLYRWQGILLDCWVGKRCAETALNSSAMAHRGVIHREVNHPRPCKSPRWTGFFPEVCDSQMRYTFFHEELWQNLDDFGQQSRYFYVFHGWKICQQTSWLLRSIK